MYLLELFWCQPVSSALVDFQLIVEFELLQQPDDALGARLVEPAYTVNTKFGAERTDDVVPEVLSRDDDVWLCRCGLPVNCNFRTLLISFSGHGLAGKEMLSG
jgi:hypothetical protein